MLASIIGLAFLINHGTRCHGTYGVPDHKRCFHIIINYIVHQYSKLASIIATTTTLQR